MTREPATRSEPAKNIIHGSPPVSGSVDALSSAGRGSAPNASPDCCVVVVVVCELLITPGGGPEGDPDDDDMEEEGIEPGGGPDDDDGDDDPGDIDDDGCACAAPTKSTLPKPSNVNVRVCRFM
jgi:hypothetical protein